MEGLPWKDVQLNSILVLLALLLFLLNIRSVTYISPFVRTCIFRWKGCVSLDASVPTGRARDITALVLMLPFCLVLDRYRIWDPEYFSLLPQWARVPAIAGTGILFLALRAILNQRFRRKNGEMYQVAHKSSHTFFIVIATTSLLIAGVLSLFGLDDLTVRKFILYGILAAYALLVIRRGQIYSSFCSPFTTILYLCALEILPTALLVASEMLL